MSKRTERLLGWRTGNTAALHLMVPLGTSRVMPRVAVVLVATASIGSGVASLLLLPIGGGP